MTELPQPKIVEPEGGHWYSLDGRLIETVPSADGKKQVKCTLRHARKLQLAPGVTTITGSCDKPQLTRWKMEQVAIAACTLTRQVGETDESWQKRLLEESGKISKESRDEGTIIHKSIQHNFQLSPINTDYKDHVDGAVRELELLGCDVWRSEVVCVSPRGFGTMADLVGYRDKVVVAIVDTKSKDGPLATLQELELYDDHYMQLAATCEAMGVDPKGIATGILFTSRTHPGSSVLKMAPLDELKRGAGMFSALLTYKQIKDGYRPDWAKD